jgi:hypothetical protein
MQQWWRSYNPAALKRARKLSAQRWHELMATDPDFRRRAVEHCSSLQHKNLSDPEWRKRQGYLGIDEIELLMQDVQNGLPYIEIGDRWLISRGEVSYHARKRGVSRRPVRKLKEPSLKQLVAIVKAARSGIEYRIIARQFRMPIHRVCGIAHRAGINRRNKQRAYWWEGLPLDRYQDLVSRLKTVEAYPDIAVDFDVSAKKISRCALQLGFRRGRDWTKGLSQERIQSNAQARYRRMAERHEDRHADQN